MLRPCPTFSNMGHPRFSFFFPCLCLSFLHLHLEELQPLLSSPGHRLCEERMPMPTMTGAKCLHSADYITMYLGRDEEEGR